MASTYEELMAASRQLYEAGDIDGARRVAKIAIERRDVPNTAPKITAEQRAANVAANASRQAEIDTAGKIALRDPGRLASTVLGAGDGFTLGFSDELQGVNAAKSGLAGDLLTGNFSGMVGRGFDRYSAEKNRASDLMSAAQDANPGFTLGGQIAGGIIPALFTGGSSAAVTGGRTAATGLKALLPAAMRSGLGATVMRGGASGAGLGALYGFGSGEGKGRVSGAMTGGAIGGALGLAAPFAIAGASRLGTAALDSVGGVMGPLGAQGRAGRVLQQAIERSGMTVDEINAAVQRAAAEGQPEFMTVDALGDAGQKALSAVALQPGKARTDIVDFMLKRQAGQGRRVGTMLDESINAPRNVGKTAEEVTDGLIAARKATSDVAYDAARTNAAPVDVTQAVDEINGLLRSNTSIDGGKTGLADTAIGKRLAAFGKQLSTGEYQSINFDDVLETKQEMFRAMEAMKRQGSVPPAFSSVYGKLDEALEASSDMYRTANDGFRTASRVIDRVKDGKASASGTVRAEDTVRKYGKLTLDEQAAFRSGYSNPLLAKVRGSRPGVNKVPALMDDATQAELGAMAKDPAMLRRQLEREQTMFGTSAKSLGGSPTAERLQDLADAGKFDLGMIANILTGRWGAAGAQLLPKLSGKNEATRGYLARALMSKDPASALAYAVKSGIVGDAPKKGLAALLDSSQRAGVNQ